SPLALSSVPGPAESSRGLEHSRTLPRSAQTQLHGYGSAQHGLSNDEKSALRQSFYWKPEFGESRYAGDSLAQLMAKSVDEVFQYGEKGENHASELALALTTVGDVEFARQLSAQPTNVQGLVLDLIGSLWRRYGLSYPLTQSIASKLTPTDTVPEGI
ncbi:MAG: hypothetical protein ACKVY0_29590, partial [Prosthecobacter sp.]|uniref:hypothetical protein n=1 Tax=Prosthecobacter sp. TaxID=1965333 RepID=UPI0038FD92F5